MKLMSKYYKQFIIKGLVAMGFGPVVLAIVYAILGATGVVEQVGYIEMTLGIITITALAFLCGAMTTVYQIEELPLAAAITLHGISIYIAYAVVYLVNGWLKEGLVSFIIFTIIFVVGYALVWLVIYLITRNGANKLNSALKKRAE